MGLDGPAGTYLCKKHATSWLFRVSYKSMWLVDSWPLEFLDLTARPELLFIVPSLFRVVWSVVRSCPGIVPRGYYEFVRCGRCSLGHSIRISTVFNATACI